MKMCINQWKNRNLDEKIPYEKDLDRIRKEMVSSVSHELKTPIFLIQGYAEGLKNNVADSVEKRSFYCDVIMEETVKMNRLVEDLLDLSKLDAGIFTLEKETVNLSQLAQSVYSKYKIILEEQEQHDNQKQHEYIKQREYKAIQVNQSIQLYADITDGILIEADPIRLEQVMVNYLNNAINHVDEAGIVTMKLEKKEDTIRFSIFNTGKPIPDQEKDKLWQRFYKIDQSKVGCINGSGLGLSIVKSILELHSYQYGIVNVNNCDQIGVEFWFEISKISQKM